MPEGPGASPDPETTLEPVFETADAAILPLATMALDQQGIEYSVQGGGTLDALRLPPPGLDVGLSDARHELVVRKGDAPRDYIDAATIEMLETSGGDPDVIALLREALAGREGMEIRF